MTLPNFFVIGAYKSGTTALYHYLRQHPELFLPSLKEPNYFAFSGKMSGNRPVPALSVTKWEEYVALYSNVINQRAIGDVSPEYMTHPEACVNIQTKVPHAKLIAILRNPIERAYSDYLMYVRDGLEHADFLQALSEQEQRAKDSKLTGFYISTGYYFTQLQPYYKHFDSNQIRVYLFEDLKSDPVGTMQNIFRFLEIDDKFVPKQMEQYNISGVPSNLIIRGIFRARGAFKPLIRPLIPRRYRIIIDRALQRGLVKTPQPDQSRELLLSIYKEDILNLQELIGRDLQHWIQIH